MINKVQLLERVYSLIDDQKLMDILFDELKQIYPYESAAFYLLDSNKEKMKITGLQLSTQFQNLLEIYKESIEIKLDGFDLLRNALKKNEVFILNEKEIEEEHNPFRKRILFFELDKKIRQALLIPFSVGKKEPIGLLMLSSSSPNHIGKEESLYLQELIAFFHPLFLNAIRMRELQEKQFHIETITQRYQKVLKFIINFNQLLAIKNYFEILTRDLNTIFGFEISFVQIEQNGKLPIKYGAAADNSKESYLAQLIDYYSLEKDAPNLYGENGPDMACCSVFLNNTHYYVKDASSFYNENIRMLPKDQYALYMLPQQLKTFFQIPISDSKKAIGMIQMWSFENIVVLSEQDIEMIHALCSFVPSVFQNISLYALIENQNKDLEKKNNIIRIQNSTYQKDIQLAAQIQQSLIPSKKINFPGANFSFLYKPMAAVGGDFFDFIPFHEHKLIGIFISDVSGHGVPAALITSMVKTLIDTAGENRIKPGKMLSFLNQKLYGQTGGNFLTAFYGIYNSEDHSFTYAKGAHNAPYLIRNQKIIQLDSKGKLIGIDCGWSYEEKTFQLQTGDKLLFYTDGLTEATNVEGVEFYENIEPVLLSQSQNSIDVFVNNLYNHLVSHKEDIHFEDDICIVGMEIK